MRIFVVSCFFFFFLVVVVSGSVCCRVWSEEQKRKKKRKMKNVERERERADKRDREQLNKVHRASNPFDKSLNDQLFWVTLRWRSHHIPWISGNYFDTFLRFSCIAFNAFISTWKRKLFLRSDIKSNSLNVDYFDWIFCIKRKHLNILFICFDFMRKQSVAIGVATSIPWHIIPRCCIVASAQQFLLLFSFWRTVNDMNR